MAEIEKKSDEIDLVEILRKLWAGRKTILISTGIGLALGIFFLIIAPVNYQSESTLLIEAEASVPPGMSALLQQIAAASGINVTGKQINDALTPDLYPMIVGSTPFLLEMIGQKVTNPETGLHVTIQQYLKDYPPQTLPGIVMGYTIGLPGKIIGLFSAEDTASDAKTPSVSLPQTSRGFDEDAMDTAYTPPTEAQLRAIKKLNACISTEAKSTTKKTIGAIPNLFTISTQAHHPEVATELNILVVNHLKRYIADYRTRKVRQDFDFITQQYDEVEEKYRRAQQSLASFKDRGQNVVFYSSRADEARLQAEYDIAFSVVKSLSQIKEQAKIKVQEQTPVFTIIEPAVKPDQSSTGGAKIMGILIFLGILAGAAIVFGKPAFIKLKEQF